jgi:hypothetical protein
VWQTTGHTSLANHQKAAALNRSFFTAHPTREMEYRRNGVMECCKILSHFVFLAFFPLFHHSLSADRQAFFHYSK